MTDSMRRRAVVGALVACGLLAACAHGPTVILLPQQDGSKSAVTVTDDGRDIVLDQPYAAVEPAWRGPRPYTSTPAEVEARFGPTLRALPARPVAFTLYFVENRDEVADESKPLLDAVLAEIARRPVPDIVVIGHTDTVGTDNVNDALALQRAEAVRAELVRRGVAPVNITASGRGKRELLVPTADGVAEPRNRRVEILVR